MAGKERGFEQVSEGISKAYTKGAEKAHRRLGNAIGIGPLRFNGRLGAKIVYLQHLSNTDP